MTGPILHQPEPEQPREIGPVDNEPSEADIAVDAALGDLVRCAYHDCPSALDEIDRLRSESKVVPEPIGVTYCTTHHGLREADESRGCAWQNDEPEQACQFVELYRGTEVVDTYLDPAYEEDEDHRAHRERRARLQADDPRDRWLRARLQIVEDHINTLRCENAQLRGDLAAAYCRMDDMEGYNDD